MRDRWDPQTLGEPHHVAPLGASGQREIKSHDPGVSARMPVPCASTVPDDDCAADQIRVMPEAVRGHGS